MIEKDQAKKEFLRDLTERFRGKTISGFDLERNDMTGEVELLVRFENSPPLIVETQEKRGSEFECGLRINNLDTADLV